MNAVADAVRTFLELGAVVGAVKPGAKNPVTTRPKVEGESAGWDVHQREGHLQPGLDRLCAGDPLDTYPVPGTMRRPARGLRAVCGDFDRPGAADGASALLGPPFVRVASADKPGHEHLYWWVPEAFSPGSVNLHLAGVHVGEWRAARGDGSSVGVGMRAYPGELEAVATAFASAVQCDTDGIPCTDAALTAEAIELTRPAPWTKPVGKLCGTLRGVKDDEDREGLLLDGLRNISRHLPFRALFEASLTAAYVAGGGGDPKAVAHALDAVQRAEAERRASMPWADDVERACTVLRGLRSAAEGGEGRDNMLLGILRPLETHLAHRAEFEPLLAATYAAVFGAGEAGRAARAPTDVSRALDKVQATDADGSPRCGSPGARSPSQSATSAPAVEVEIVTGKTLRGVEYCMGKLGHETMWNTRSVRFDWREQGGGVWSWTELDDLKAHSFRREIEERFAVKTTRGTRPLSFGKDAFFDGLGALADSKRFDPFVEWLRQLPAWDGEERLRFIIDSVFEVEDGELYPDEAERLRQWQSRLPLVAAVARALKPGAVADVVSTILGPQGIGKSRFFRELLPPEGREEWFSDSLPLDASEKEWAEALSGPVIVESSELSGLRRADTEKMKARLSRRVMRYRPAYARLTGTFPLRAAVVATCNRETPLPNDESGNRRFVVCRVRCVRPDAWTWLNAHREQLWAEALHAVEVGGETGAIPPELAPVLAAANSGLRDSNEAAEHVVTELAPWLDEEPRAMTEIAAQIARRAACGQGLEDTEIGLFVARETLAVMSSKARQSELGRALTVCGYRSKRSTCNGVRASRWARDEAA